MGNIANSFTAFLLIFGLSTALVIYFTIDIGFVTSISVIAPPGIKIVPVYESALRGIDCIPRYTPAYIQLWITNELNTPVYIYNLTILPKGQTVVAQVCDYAPNINADNTPAQQFNGTLEPQQTVVILVEYKLNYPFYIGSLTIILHANTST